MSTASTRTSRAGFSMIGMLITLACILVLFVISMNALNKAVTGQGSALRGTVRSTQDMMALHGLYQSVIISGQDHGDSRFVVPSVVAQRDDVTQNTTANLFSAMVALRYTNTASLIAANEYSGYVWEMEDYDYTAYDPASGTWWDSRFKADLHDLSNVSFAHMPLIGERFERGWKANFNSDAVLIGNRGPKDGIHDPHSMTVGRNQQWGGHVLFGDGRIEFFNTFTPSNLSAGRDGRTGPDNIFAMEDGPEGRDAILAFTKAMTRSGPELQYD